MPEPAARPDDTSAGTGAPSLGVEGLDSTGHSQARPVRSKVVVAAAVSSVALVLYALTLAPTVTLVDSGELIVAARTLGVAHPPGFPLYLLLAHAASLVPVGRVAARVNSASALFAALACGAFFLLVTELLRLKQAPAAERRDDRKKAPKRRRGKRRDHAGPEARGPRAVDATDDSSTPPWITMASAVTVSMMLACSRTLWGYATIAEVYTLNALIIVVILALIVAWRRRSVGEARSSLHAAAGDKLTGTKARSRTDRLVYLAAFVFGLGLCNHHVTVGLLLPGLAVAVLATDVRRFAGGRRVGCAALCCVAGLAVYAYLPLAASRSPAMNWGDPRTLERFWWHVTGRQYQTFLAFDPKLIAEFLRYAGREFGPVWFPVVPALAVLGAAVFYRRDRVVSLSLGLIVAANLAFGFCYEIAEDKDAYYLPTFIVLAAAAAVGVRWSLERLSALDLPRMMKLAAVTSMVIVVPSGAFWANVGHNNKSRYFIAEDYVQNILSTVSPGGLLLTTDWQVYSPMFYLDQVEGRRRDVISIDVSLLRRSWYFDFLKRAYPDLVQGSQAEVDAFLQDLVDWEHDPALYQRDATLNQRINRRFYDMILSFVSTQLDRGAVYVTQDIAAGRNSQDAELTQSLATSYQLVPQGLVFEVVRDKEFHEPATPILQTRGLADGTLRFDKDDTVSVKVLPTYIEMLINRGRYLAAYGRHESAIEAYNQALVLDPDSRLARRYLAESQSALSNAPLPQKQ